MKRQNRSKVSSRNNQIQLPQLHTNEMYQEVDITLFKAHSNKSLLYSESVEVPEPKEENPDQKQPN